jgi:hypothetical protein
MPSPSNHNSVPHTGGRIQIRAQLRRHRQTAEDLPGDHRPPVRLRGDSSATLDSGSSYQDPSATSTAKASCANLESTGWVIASAITAKLKKLG